MRLKSDFDLLRLFFKVSVDRWERLNEADAEISRSAFVWSVPSEVLILKFKLNCGGKPLLAHRSTAKVPGSNPNDAVFGVD
jgi:hypothetical protein